MDFVHDTLAGGGEIRALSVIDTYTRECLALAVDTTVSGEKVASVRPGLRDERGLPPWITVDNGTELTSRALDHRAYWNKMELDLTRPGKPADNTHLEPSTARSGGAPHTALIQRSQEGPPDNSGLDG